MLMIEVSYNFLSHQVYCDISPALRRETENKLKSELSLLQSYKTKVLNFKKERLEISNKISNIKRSKSESSIKQLSSLEKELQRSEQRILDSEQAVDRQEKVVNNLKSKLGK